MLALPRADAATRWRIAERGAPSPRAYERLLARWSAAYLAWAYEQLRRAAGEEGVAPGHDLTPSTVAALGRRLERRLQDGAPPPPDLREVSTVGRPAIRAAVRAEHRELVAAGMPRDWLVRRSGLVVPGSLGGFGGLRADEDDTVRPALGPPRSPPSGIDILLAGPGERVLVGWAEEGRSLIRTLAEEVTRDLPRLVVQAAASGRRWESLVGAVEAMGAKTAARARLIARDQVAKVNGRVTQEMQTAAGLTHFHWEHAGDERVRESHRRAATRDVGFGPGVYSWAEGAPDVGFYGTAGFPGQAGQCRCRARPKLPKGLREAWAAAA